MTDPIDIARLRRAFCWAAWSLGPPDRRYDRIPEIIADAPAAERHAAADRALLWASYRGVGLGVYDAALRLCNGLSGIEKPLEILDQCIASGRPIVSVRFADPGLIYHRWTHRRDCHMGVEYWGPRVIFVDDELSQYAIPRGLDRPNLVVEYMSRSESP